MSVLKSKPLIKMIPFSKGWLLYEDENILVVNKPSGLLSVPGRNADPSSSLIGQVLTYCTNALIVHRLDMDTSGIMLLAKNADCHRLLSRQFQNRLIKKQYQAICAGIVSQNSGFLNQPMRCDWENRPLQMIDFKQGRSATTYWQLVEQKESSFKIILTPVSGRSHQLRLHMKQLGHPILGDNLYADSISLKLASRLMLHASSLIFEHPFSAEKICIKSESSFWV